MKLIFANHYEALEAALLDDLAAMTPADPLTPQHIVIPSLAIRRRLELGYAQRFGICANLHPAYLAQWLWEQIGCFVQVPTVSPFAPNLLVWRLYRLLSHEPRSEASRLASYLGAADEVMRFELAERLAILFDHYLTYRPEWLAAWSANRQAEIGSSQAVHREDAAWQAELWRQVIAELGLNPFHPAADFFVEARRLGPEDPRLSALPRAVFVFCLPTMPPLYVHLLTQLAQWVEVRLYVLNPCRQYWFEIVDRKRLSSLALAGRELYHETGNQLLAAWGKETQAQIDLLLSETGDQVVVDDSRFAVNARPTLLAAWQNAILDLVPLAPLALHDEDRSIEVHACHHLNRQLEVLHDQLLHLFNSDDPPRPDEVLVVTPDLGAAAPLIDAVFGTAPPKCRIPFCITGRPATQENTIARLLLQLLTLPQSRFAASEVFQLLQEVPIARRFALEAEDFHLIQRWLQHSGIRWGLDADHRLACGLAGSARHTFGEGVPRLFLGYAMPDGGDRLVGGILPCAMGEGGQTQALGRFWLFIDTLRAWREGLALARSAEEWQQALLALTETFFDPGDDHLSLMQEVRVAIADLSAEAMAVGAEVPLSLAVIRHALQERLSEPARGGVPSGRVTFAAMSSLRGLPYRVVCFLGLDDGLFPSAGTPVEFDLMVLAPQRGDLQRQSDERNLFLDLLLAARDQVIICYSGRSIRDNAPLPPSVLVAELLDQLLPAIAVDESEAALRAARCRLVVEHPLQAFSARYFRPGADARLFSFDAEYCEAARLLAAGPRPFLAVDLGDEEDGSLNAGAPLFFVEPLPPVDEPWRMVGFEQLLSFFRNPCRYLLADRLGVELLTTEAELTDDEPFVLDWGGWRSVVDRLLPLLLGGEEIGLVEALAAAGHEFPDGKPGDLLRQRELARLNEFAAVVRPALTGLRPEPLPFTFDFEMGGEAWTLSGALTGLGPRGLVRYRGDRTRPGDYLTAWLCHLALCALRPEGVKLATRHLSLDGEFTFRPVDNARALFTTLLACYREGLCRPLHFFPKSAWAFIVNAGDMGKAYQRWRSTARNPHGEESDPYTRLALRGEVDPLADGAFEELARTIYDPLLHHLEDSRL